VRRGGDRTLRIYIASSWKNKVRVRELARVLRESGYEVFDFTDPDSRPRGLSNFVFSAVESLGRDPSEIDYKEFLEYEVTRRAFEADRAGLDWAEVVVLLLPAGNSSHLEAGYAKGREKTVVIFGDLPRGRFETMYHFVDACYRSNELEDMLRFLQKLSVSPNTNPEG